MICQRSQQRTPSHAFGSALVAAPWVCAWLLMMAVTAAAAEPPGAPDPHVAPPAEAEAPPPDEASPAARQPLLYEQEPFDILLLKDPPDTRERVVPLDLPGRRLPEKPPPTDVLRVRPLSDPARWYEVAWKDIAGVLLFERMVLDEARGLIDAGRFDAAYECLVFLAREYPRLPGFDDAYADCLLAEAGHFQRAGKLELALARLQQLAGVQPAHSGLAERLADITRQLVDAHLDARRDLAALALVDQLTARLADRPEAAAVARHLRDHAAALLDQARSAADRGDWPAAQQSSLRAVRLAPRLDEARSLLLEAVKQHPLLTVGVTAPAPPAAGWRLDDWAARRAARLVERRLVEFEAVGEEGGRYSSPLARLEVDPLERRLTLQFHRRAPSSDALPMAFDVVRGLLEMARPDRPAYDPRWALFCQGLEVADQDTLVIRLARAHVRPEALLASILLSRQRLGLSTDWVRQSTPYIAGARQTDSVRFALNPDYFAAQQGQPVEIVERAFPDAAAALQALARGELSVVDRLSPLEAESLKQRADLVVRRYAVPTVHVLVPNPQNPLLASRTFRRALVYGIHREAILERLLGRRALPGCRVASGVFPMGVDFNDPLRYAYDPTIAPRPYDARLASALAGAAYLERVANAARGNAAAEGNADAQQTLSLVIAHPPSGVAPAACRDIARYLARLGIEVSLRPWQPGRLPPSPGDADLTYLELMLAEPLVDAAALFGPAAMIRDVSPYLSLAVDRLERAESWSAARSQLLQLHRLIHDELPVIPLWQLTEHLAVDRAVQGLADSPVVLYQQIEQWRIVPRLPEVRP